MKVSNLDIAVSLSAEIEALDKALVEADELIKSGKGFVIRQHSDGSDKGNIDYIYEDGNWPKEMYAQIAKAIKDALNMQRDKLIKEVEGL